jgi:hypothetical protein
MIPLRFDKPLLPGGLSRAASGDSARRFRAALSSLPAREDEPPVETEGGAGTGTPTGFEDVPTPETIDDASLHDLRDLWDELVQTLQAGHRLSSAHWSLRLRLDETAFPLTALTLACAAGELALTLCTASDAVHERLLTQLPALNRRLQRHGAVAEAVVRLVTPEELDA